MPSPTAEARRLGERLKLDVGRRMGGPLGGERMGTGTGASLEFHDRRAYQVGDDLRHLDWRAYARTDQLIVRQYREEVRPRVELLLDDSRSMRLDPEKAQLAVDLATVLGLAAERAGFQASCQLLGDEPQRVSLERFLELGAEFEATESLAQSVSLARGLFQPGGLRIVVSDFLSPYRAETLVRALATQASELLLVQVLAQRDADPPLDQPLRLTDAETGEVLDLFVDAATRETYLGRLERLQAELADECRRMGGRFLTVQAAPIETVCRDVLAPRGLLVAE